MRLFPLLVLRRDFRSGVLSYVAGMFPVGSRREEARDLPPYLQRDIGLEERCPPDWERLLR